MRLHTHVALLHNSVLLGSEVLFLLLMASGIYMRNSGLRAFKIMFREVRDHPFHVVGLCVLTKFIFSIDRACCGLLLPR